eukprot:4155273-Pleurochrysis_carterae.AAC.1
MQDNNNLTDFDTVSPPSWDSSQLDFRAWLDDVAAWLPSQHSNYSPLIEYGYVLTSQGSVAAYNLDHALHCRSCLLVAHSFDAPSPRNPVFTAQGPIRLRICRPPHARRVLNRNRRHLQPPRLLQPALLPQPPSRHLVCRNFQPTKQSATS